MTLPKWLTPWRKHTDLNTVTPIRSPFGAQSMFGWISESFGGSWQSNLALSHESQLAFSAVFACISLRSRDIAKLRLRMLRKAESGIWEEDEKSAFAPLLRKPNRYQTRQQFMQYWVICKLTWGNTYVLKERDARGMVRAMYILNPVGVRPLVAPDGDVFYQISSEQLAGFQEGATVPASEIIHDRGECLFHQLVGVSPLYAAGMAAAQGNRIQSNSQTFFTNQSRPGGMISAPGTIPDPTAARLKNEFEKNFSGGNIGRLFVAGDGLKFEPFSIPAEQAQLIEQLKWTGEDVARAFLVPAYKIGLGATPSLGHVAALNQEYYQQALQEDIEAIEALLDEGLALPTDLSAEFDLEGLLRMDPKTRAEVDEIGVKSGVVAPNEARRRRDLPPVNGGDSPYLQEQNFSLAALAKRDALEDPWSSRGGGDAPRDDERDGGGDEIDEDKKRVPFHFVRLVATEDLRSALGPGMP